MPAQDKLDLRGALQPHLTHDESLEGMAVAANRNARVFVIPLLTLFCFSLSVRTWLVLGGASFVAVTPAAILWELLWKSLGVVGMVALTFVIAPPVTWAFRRGYVAGLTNRRLIVIEAREPVYGETLRASHPIRIHSLPLESLSTKSRQGRDGIGLQVSSGDTNLDIFFFSKARDDNAGNAKALVERLTKAVQLQF